MLLGTKINLECKIGKICACKISLYHNQGFVYLKHLGKWMKDVNNIRAIITINIMHNIHNILL